MKNERPAGSIATVPNCGVVALAATTGYTIEDITAWFRNNLGKGPRWQGRLHWHELQKFLKAQGIGFKAAWSPSGSLKRYVEDHTVTTDDRGYIIRVGGHFVAVIGGEVIDQTECALAADHWAKAKRVSHAMELVL